MKVIRPTIVTDAILTSSSIAESEYPAWAAPTSYAVGGRVIRGHAVWESLVAANAGNDPLTAANQGTKWLKIGADNRWAMFDQAKGSLSSAAGQIVVVLTAGRIDSLALTELTAKQVTVSVTVGGAEVYRRTQVTAIGGRSIDNWYDWFFAPIGTRTKLLFDDLPSYRNAVVTVTIDPISGTASCGTLLVGRMFDIGTTLSGVDLGIDDFSQRNRDQFGVLSIVPRDYSDINSYPVAIQSSRVDDIKGTLTDLRTTPTVWIGSAVLDALFTYGIVRSFRINLTLLTGISNCSLDIESL